MGMLLAMTMAEGEKKTPPKPEKVKELEKQFEELKEEKKNDSTRKGRPRTSISK